MVRVSSPRAKAPFSWSAANGGLRDGGLSKSEDIWRKKGYFLRFLDFPGARQTLRKRAKKAEQGRKGWKRPIARKGGQTPLKPPFVTPPFAAAQFRQPRLKTFAGQVRSAEVPTWSFALFCAHRVSERPRRLLLSLRVPCALFYLGRA